MPDSPLVDVSPYDALLLVSFGGPEAPDEVVPFLENVTAGRNIPRERLEEVGKHYHLFGGKSPINDQNRALLAAVRCDLDEVGIDLPVYWGNRNWDPYLRDAMAQMAADGIRRVACFVTSAYSSWSGCRQYRENLYDAAQDVDGAPRLDKLRHYFNLPGFIEPAVDATLAALDELPDDVRDGAHLAFVTHSIPTTMARTSGPEGGAYVAQHEGVAELVTAAVQARTGVRHQQRLVYCSRSGPPQMPWLEPDINDHLVALAAAEAPAVVMVPVGFVSDHMEVIYDLDTEAIATAADLGLPAARAITAGTDPRFVSLVRDLLVERAAVERGEQVHRVALGDHPATWDRCPIGCCPNPRSDRPAASGAVS